MKTSLRLLAFAVIASIASIAAASGSPSVGANNAVVRHDHSHAAAEFAQALSDAPKAERYTCPMHPEVISDKPGKCPKCGMNLVPVKDAPKK